MIDPKEAVVELEVIGYQFSLNEGEIQYKYGELEYPITEFIKTRITAIKYHKNEIFEWLKSRTFCEIAWSLCRILERRSSQYKNMQRIYGDDSTYTISSEKYYLLIYSAYLRVLNWAKTEQLKNPGNDYLPLPTKFLLTSKLKDDSSGIYEVKCEE